MYQPQPRAGSFQRLAQGDPSQSMRAVGVAPTPSREPLLGPGSTDSPSPRPAPGNGGASNAPDIVQWAAPMYYLDEAEGSIKLDVMRLGSFAGPCSVDWHTEDGSAVAGRKYHAKDGTVKFKDGEYMKSVEVFTIGDDYWAPTLDFKCLLTEARGCQVSDYLNICRIKICDDDPFPSSKYKDQLLQGKEGLKEIWGPGLFWEYFKLNLQREGVVWRSALCLVVDQLPNAYLAFTIWVGLYLVDDLFREQCGGEPRGDDDEPCTNEPLQLFGFRMESRQTTAMAIGILWFSPQFPIHAWKLFRVYLDLDGRARSFLQEGLLRKYLNYDDESRNECKESDVLVSVTEDCAECAAAYLGILDMIALIGKLCVLTFFILQQNRDAVWACVVMPSLMLLFACSRFKILIEASANEGDRQVDMIALADETCEKYRLIADYGQKPEMSDMFQERVRALQEAKVISNRVDCNDNQVPDWVGSFFVGGYIALNAKKVLVDRQTLGVFLATVSILGEIAEDFSEFYTLTMQLAKSLEPLKGLTYFFNLKMDLQTLKSCCENNRAKTKSKLAEVIEDMRVGRTGGAQGAREAHLKFAADKMDIELVKVGFEYCLGGPSAQVHIVEDVSISVSQASIVAIVGEHGAGRSTLLSLMSREKHPSSGFLFLPQHLRVLHVAQEPVLLSLSLLENLTFGGTPTNVAGRIVAVLKGLKMPKVIAILEEEMEKARAHTKPKKKHRHAEVSNPSKIVHAAAAKVSGNSALKFAEGDDEDEDEWESEEEEEEEEEDATWHDTITYTDKVKIHLARALIVNPEVMVLQRPLYHFNKETGMEVLQVLKNFVDRRGYKLPGGQAEHDRRPRTVFFVPEDLDQAAEADVIWHLDGNTHKITELFGAKGAMCLSPEFALLRRP